LGCETYKTCIRVDLTSFDLGDRLGVCHTCCSYMVGHIVKVGAQAENGMGLRCASVIQLMIEIGIRGQKMVGFPSQHLPSFEVGVWGCYTWKNLGFYFIVGEF